MQNGRPSRSRSCAGSRDRNGSATMKAKSTWFDGIEDARLNAILKERASKHRKGPSLLPEAGAAPGFVFMRPPCRGDDCTDWPPKHNPPDDPCGGLDWAWQPDLAARLVTNDPC